jgi:fumarate hydratase class II
MMACLQVLGADTTVSMAGAEGNFELNAFRPIVISNFVRSGTLLADVSHGLSRYLVRGLELSERMRDETTDLDSVTLATALAVHIGHERAAAIARTARANHIDVLTEARTAGVDESIIETVREAVDHLRRVS